MKTVELAPHEGESNRLSPDELGILALQLASVIDATEVARIRERLTRGFYG